MIKNLLSFILVILALFILSRLIFDYLPGNAMDIALFESGHIYHSNTAQENKEHFIHLALLDLKKMSLLDFGISSITQKPIFPQISNALAVSLKLTVYTIALSLTLSLFIGLSCAQNTHQRLKKICSLISTWTCTWTASIPIVITAPFLLYTFSVFFPIFNVSGSAALCSITLSLFYIGLWSRMIKNRVSESLTQNYCIGARARGVAELKILLKYGFIPSSASLFAVIGTHIGGLLAGSFVAEFIFNLHGLGTLFVESILSRDYPLMQKSLFITSSIAFMGTYLGKIIHNHIDPRDIKT